MKPTIAIAGASGFVGRWFMDQYKHKYKFIALSRKEVVENLSDAHIEWRKVELYSITSTVEALQGADYALYFVHSMVPSTRLNQGSFENTDILLADNFSRAAEINGLKQIIFLGGILPKDGHQFSTHLRSRYEVEQTLSSRSVPLTALRAGIIVGPGGSSFRMIEKLVHRLPIMLCPKWTLSRTQPIALEDTLKCLDYCLSNENTYHKAYDIGGKEITTYLHMIEQTAELMDKKRIIASVPFFSPGFSKLWVAVFTDSSTTLVSPLVESLRHELIVEPNALMEKFDQRKSFREAAKRALFEKDTIPKLPKRTHASSKNEKNTVRSVQRLPNPGNKSASWVAQEYMRWLPSYLRYIVKVDVNQEENTVTFRIFSFHLLKMYFVRDRSDDNRRLFYIVDGLLVKRKDYGWLEFRRVLNGRYFICAIHEFVPSLPWFIYIPTQAVIHLFVMKAFGRYLKRQS